MTINENQIRNNITKQIQNQIAQQRQSINHGLATQKQEYDNTINRNKQYLNEQIQSLNNQRIQNDDKTVALQNRRGGFYSGGLDYQLAQNLKNTTGAQDNIRRDINSQNQGILDKYNTVAKQAADQISLLEQQAPDKIRELVNAELDRQRQYDLQLQQLAISRANASRARSGSGGGSYPSGNSNPKSKDQSYNDWLGYFSQNKDAINSMGFQNFENQLRQNKSMVNNIEGQGYNLNSVIDAMYNAASGGRFNSKQDYMNTLSSRQSRQTGAGVRELMG